MSEQITALQVVDRIKDQLGTSWQELKTDVFCGGNPGTVVTGIATSFTPSIEVLQKAADSGKNLIITHQPDYYLETEEYMANDPAFEFKKALIEKNKLVVWRFDENWCAREVDGQLLGLTKALGWDEYHIEDPSLGIEPYNPKNKYFKLPETSFPEMVTYFKERLKIPGLYVEVDPEIKV